MVIIPTFADPSYIQVTNIDGTDYVLEFAWHERSSIWRLNISNIEGAPLATNIPLHVGQDLLVRPRAWGAATPPGLLIVIDTSGVGIDPAIDELGNGKRCVLAYFTVAEIQAAA